MVTLIDLNYISWLPRIVGKPKRIRALHALPVYCTTRDHGSSNLVYKLHWCVCARACVHMRLKLECFYVIPCFRRALNNQDVGPSWTLNPGRWSQVMHFRHFLFIWIVGSLKVNLHLYIWKGLFDDWHHVTNFTGLSLTD